MAGCAGAVVTRTAAQRCSVSGALNLLVALLILGSSCARQYAERTTPDRVAPHVILEPGEPQEGQGRVTIDVVDGPADVAVVASEGVDFIWSARGSATAWGQTVAPVCTSPCAANLPFGSYRIKTSVLSDPSIGDDDGILIVEEQPTTWRRAPTITKKRTGLLVGGVTMTILGLVIGPGLLVVGAKEANSSDPLLNSGVLFGTGAAFTVMGLAGIPMILKGRTEIWPGTQVQW